MLEAIVDAERSRSDPPASSGETSEPEEAMVFGGAREIARLTQQVADLTAELRGLRDRIANRKPLPQLRDWDGKFNLRKADGEIPRGYARPSGSWVETGLRRLRLPEPAGAE